MREATPPSWTNHRGATHAGRGTRAGGKRNFARSRLYGPPAANTSTSLTNGVRPLPKLRDRRAETAIAQSRQQGAGAHAELMPREHSTPARPVRGLRASRQAASDSASPLHAARLHPCYSSLVRRNHGNTARAHSISDTPSTGACAWLRAVQHVTFCTAHAHILLVSQILT